MGDKGCACAWLGRKRESAARSATCLGRRCGRGGVEAVDMHGATRERPFLRAVRGRRQGMKACERNIVLMLRVRMKSGKAIGKQSGVEPLTETTGKNVKKAERCKSASSKA